MKVLILNEAEIELKETISYYNEQMENLGNKFYSDFLSSLDTILLFPYGWAKIQKNTRKFIIKQITSIAHQHRKPSSYLK